MIDDVIITPLEIIETFGGNVMHAMKKTDLGYADFGEAYFSEIEKNKVKAWKRHKDMTLNLIVPLGKIKFVMFDDRKESNNRFQEVIISKENYCRLTVPPMIWVGFKGLSSFKSILLNIASIPHNPKEVDKKEIDKIQFDWSG
jgi:dTDP-4-dehydrorhamnose 3,5-epimerase